MMTGIIAKNAKEALVLETALQVAVKEREVATKEKEVAMFHRILAEQQQTGTILYHSSVHPHFRLSATVQL